VFIAQEIIGITAGRLLKGDSCARVKGVSTDTRILSPGDAFVALKGENFDGHNFIPRAVERGASCIISQKAYRGTLPKGTVFIKVKDTSLALGGLARFKRSKFSKPLAAVTGSNGKTTVKDMICHVISGSGRVLKNEGTKNNHIGLPQTLLKLGRQHDFAVVEIGTNHFGEVGYLSGIACPDIGVITNIGPSHLEYFKNLEGVFREKSCIFKALSGPRIGLVNADDPYLKRLIGIKNPGYNLFSYGIKEKADFRAGMIRASGNGIAFRINRKQGFLLHTPGRHNVYNALAAAALGRILGLEWKEISRRLEDFIFPPGRLRIFKLGGVDFIDDTYNSNPLSLSVALDALKGFRCRGRRVLVMGDMLELGREKELLHRRAAGSITNICDVLIAVGGLSAFTAKEAKSLGFEKDNIFCCADSRQARDLLFNKISPGAGDVILVKGSRSMRMEEVFKI